MTLSDYLTQVSLLLHDRVNAFYQVPDLTSYINTARAQVVRDTGCLRNLTPWTVVVGQEVYPLSTFSPETQSVIDVLNINLIFGNTRFALSYYPWTKFNARMRSWQNFQQRPVVFSTYGGSSIYIAPQPDQAYAMEADCVYLPTFLELPTDAEVIADPYTTAVKFFAAHLAKMYEQSYNDAEMFRQNYRREIQNIIGAVQTRRIVSPYLS